MKQCWISLPRKSARPRVERNLPCHNRTDSACIAGHSSQEGTGQLTAMCLLVYEVDTGSAPYWGILPDHALSVYLLLLIL